MATLNNVTVRLATADVGRTDALVERLAQAARASGAPWSEQSITRGEVLRRAIAIGLDALEASTPAATAPPKRLRRKAGA